jgi:thymidylate synthase
MKGYNMKEIPVLHARGKSLAEAYENALVELYANGGRMSTQYDKPGDPQSIDATMNITIEEPLSDPMIHKAFPGGIQDLREYVYELEGLKDSWTKNINDPKDTRWEYTYHQRLGSYGQYKGEFRDLIHIPVNGTEIVEPKIRMGGDCNVNQIEYVINKLVKQPFTRQAQMITWLPKMDLECYDPPCLQSLWLRITEESGIKYLNTNIRFRSNDAWGAYAINAFGFTMFIKEQILDKIVEKTGWNLKMGRINWQADSWHIYGKDIQQAKERLFDRIATTKFEDRVLSFYDPDIQEMYHECEQEILEKIKNMNEKFGSA